MKRMNIPDELKRFDPGPAAEESDEQAPEAEEQTEEGTGALAD